VLYLSLLHDVEICLFSTIGFHPDVPSYPFDEKFDNFAFNCLLTREEAIVAMAKVRSECNKVASMSVFQVPVSKSMKLEEFEQTQAQVSTQVQTQLNISKMNMKVRTSFYSCTVIFLCILTVLGNMDILII